MAENPDQQPLFSPPQQVEVTSPLPLPVRLDPEEDRALKSLSTTIQEVRDSISSINNKMGESVEALNRISNSGGMSGGGGAPQMAGPSSGAAGGPRSGEPSSPSAQAPGSPQSDYPLPDEAGYGGVQGGGGLDDMGSPIPPSRSGSPSSGASRATVEGAPSYMQNTDWWSGKLAIPRINEFNIQDYTRMASKGVGSGPLKRYNERYDQTYQQSRSDGASHEEAVQQASEAANNFNDLGFGEGRFDKARLRAASAFTKIGALGPYEAAARQLSPTILRNGAFFAPGIGAHLGSGLGISTYQPKIGGNLKSIANDLMRGEIPDSLSHNEGIRRFYKAGMSNREFMDPSLPGLFPLADRAAFAESSFNVGMQGGVYNKAVESYAMARNNAKPAGAYSPEQYVTLMQEQARYSTTATQAAANLDRLANAALNAQMSVSQLGGAAQEFAAANAGAVNMSQGIQRAAGYAEAGVDPRMGSDIVNSPIVQGELAMRYGVQPYAAANADPSVVMGASADVAKRIMNTYSSVKGSPIANISDFDAQASAAARSIGVTKQTFEMMLKGKELAANANAIKLMNNGGSAEDISNALSQAQVRGADGEWLNFSEEERAWITAGTGQGGSAFSDEVIDAYAQGTGKKRSELTPGDLQKLGYADIVARKAGMGTEDIQKALKNPEELQKLLAGQDDSQKIKVEFTGKAGNWFKQHENDLQRQPDSPTGNPSGTSPNR